MKTIELSNVPQFIQHRHATLRSESRRILLAAQLLCALALPLRATTVNAIFNSANDVPITASSYTATGNTLQISVNFAPPTGTNLTVVRNTGLNFIQGKFDNLAHGQIVNFNYGGRNYYFIANYHAHGGRDLVLQWMNVKPFAWGAGADGKLGNNATANSSQAVQVNTAGALWGKFPSSGSAGGGHSLGLCSDGTVVSWGLNSSGQLGINSTTPSKVPVGVSVSGVPSTRTVVAVAAGANHSLALCSDGKAVAWGLNTNGQLGDGTTDQRNSPVNVIASGVLSGKTVVAISAGASHSLALCSDGTVAAWGLNTNGQLGDNTTDPRNVPVAITGGILSGKTVVAISAGASHSLALCSDGTVAAWGLNTNGQLGDNTTDPRNVPVAVIRTSGALFEKTITMISAGGFHSLALCSDGTVAAWGLNSSGQLGNGNNTQSSLPVAVFSTGVLNGESVFMVSAGANHSIAQCTDGTVATWGMGTNGQLGNNNMSDSNVPVLVDGSGLDSGWFGGEVSGFAGVISGPAADHALAVVASPEIDLSHCGFHKQITYTQSSGADPTLDTDSPFNFYSYANQGPMGALLASSSLTPPVGGTGLAVYENGSNGLQLSQTFRTKTDMDTAYPTGTYQMSIHTSTPNLYPVALILGVDNYPAVPKITGTSNATWENGVLKITNTANETVITWDNPFSNDTWFQIDNTQIHKDNSTPSTSFTIPANSLVGPNSFYRASVMLMKGSATASISGLPGTQADSGYQTQVQFMIQVGTPTSEEPPMYLMIKAHNQVQSSNNDPVDAPNPLPDSDLAPYSLTVESPVGGTLTGPSATSFPLNLHADSDGPSYEYLSPSATSATALNASHPNGTYTFPGEAVTVDMPADAYPATAKILSVNGGTPVWNAQGQLALDPTIENTITWSAVSVPNFATQGHQSMEFANYRDYNFESIEIERGVLTADPNEPPETSITIPESSMTPTYTYMGYIGYAYAPGIYQPSTGVYALGGHETYNQFMAGALKPQTITFGTIPSKVYPSTAFTIGASASSGLPVTFAVISGPATVNGNTVTLVGVGTVTIRASQAGTGVHASAVSVDQSFVVYPNKLAQFRANNGLAADGSQDLLTPAGDGVPNLLKFAFNMIGSDPGQASSLAVPNVQIVGTDGAAGLPRRGESAGKLTITYIRRKSTSTPGVTYAVEFSNTLSTGSWAINAFATESAASIDTNFERVTVTDHAVFAQRFARVRVITN